MPELPDVELYVSSLDKRITGELLERIRLNNPFLLRSVEPTPAAACGRRVTGVRRLGKRIAIGLDGDLWLVIHLMIAGRFRWSGQPAKLGGKTELAAFDFASGSLKLTEAGTQKRASLHIVAGSEGLALHDPGGLEPLACRFDEFAARLTAENRTLKRALTNPRAFSGIGNAYSDEILHAARLSPVTLTSRLSADEQRRLFEATRDVLDSWRRRLADAYRDRFPDRVTAFRPDMAVHGRFGLPCPDCGSPVQRIRYQRNETNYCARCQTGGRIYADRSLSRLLKDDWPDELES